MRGLNKEFKMIAKTMMGLEDVLAGELIALGANNLEIGKRMVSFTGDLTLMYRANVCCRTALRILRPVYSFNARNTDDIYKKIKAMNWAEHLSVDSTFAIDAVTFSDVFNHSKFVAYRVKDAIVDYFMQRSGERPSVNIDNPDLLINFHIAQNTCTLSFDSSGESLHKRGYRVAQTEAPLNEVLAAGMILKSGWHGESNFVDPMCGSGTLLIEAALIATNTPPGIYRKSCAFEKWKNFNQDLFESIYNDDSNERQFNFKIYGSDISNEAVEIARSNIKSAGMSQYIDLKVMPIEDYKEAPAEGGMLIFNPPYGERLKPENIDKLYEAIGERLKHVFPGYKAWILSHRKECFGRLGLKHSAKIPLKNGSLDCEFRCYDLFAGKRKEIKKED